ncbi:hypothetical protein CgunFtcFv8_004939 [Champsocephalus gunnari]|uniref:Uncharacterized protein n=1 Tax=Champsocephalus gunnari TaxID=52237 RepID=A0AAN8CUM8_CHAGU|nr:hypothetical protein CgunFtcFv8_004939 [Champsocephalus gunnari]
MESWVRFNSQSQAKERIIRAAQYACTLLGYTLQKGGAAADLLHTVSQLEAHMSLSRKLLRLGSSVEALEAAKRAIHLSDGVLRLCLTISHLNRAMYFACDNILWAGKTGLVPEVDLQKWSQRSFRWALLNGMFNDKCMLLEPGVCGLKSAAVSGEDETGSYREDETGSHGEDETGSYGEDETGSYREDETGSYREDETGSYREDETGSYREDETGSYGEDETGSYREDETGSYGKDETGSYGKDETGSYGKDETGSYGEDETGSYGEDETGS